MLIKRLLQVSKNLKGSVLHNLPKEEYDDYVDVMHQPPIDEK